MSGTEKTDILLEKLKADSAEYKELETKGYSIEEKKNAIRSLMNIRMPGGLPDELVNLQNEYLQEERKAKGIVRLADIPTIREQFNSKSPHAEKISLWQGDITRLEVGAIVNAFWNIISNLLHSAVFQQENFIFRMIRRRKSHGKQ